MRHRDIYYAWFSCFSPVNSFIKMADELDVEAMLEAPFKKSVS